jgi:hypothetical protein
MTITTILIQTAVEARLKKFQNMIEGSTEIQNCLLVRKYTITANILFH